MLQKEAQVVPESVYSMVSGEAMLYWLFNKGGKPLESLSETVLRTVVWRTAGGTRWGPIVFFISLSKALELNMWSIMTLFYNPVFPCNNLPLASFLSSKWPFLKGFLPPIHLQKDLREGQGSTQFLLTHSPFWGLLPSFTKTDSNDSNK